MICDVRPPRINAQALGASCSRSTSSCCPPALSRRPGSSSSTAASSMWILALDLLVHYVALLLAAPHPRNALVAMLEMLKCNTELRGSDTEIRGCITKISSTSMHLSTCALAVLNTRQNLGVSLHDT